MCINCGCNPVASQHAAGHHHHGDGDEAAHHHHDQQTEEGRKVRVETDILATNNRLAAYNRHLFESKGVLALNLVSSPGSGKTTILERTLVDMADRCHSAVVEGDQQTDRDAARIAATGAPVRQINTGSGCHLDAHMICHAIEAFDLERLDLLVMENVGNLVCPAAFDLGEAAKVVVLSVTEGEDKPLKYPQMFNAAKVMLLNKVDLLPYLEFDVAECLEMARRVNPDITVFQLSARTGEGMDSWYGWLEQQLATMRSR